MSECSHESIELIGWMRSGGTKSRGWLLCNTRYAQGWCAWGDHNGVYLAYLDGTPVGIDLFPK